MSTNKAVVSPPIKHEGNLALGTALIKFANAIQAAPSKITDHKSIFHWVSPENEEEAKAYIKYCLELGGIPKLDGNCIQMTFKADNLYCFIGISTTWLKSEEITVPVEPKKVKKIVDFPELEAALSPTEPKS